MSEVRPAGGTAGSSSGRDARSRDRDATRVQRPRTGAAMATPAHGADGRVQHTDPGGQTGIRTVGELPCQVRTTAVSRHDGGSGPAGDMQVPVGCRPCRNAECRTLGHGRASKAQGWDRSELAGRRRTEKGLGSVRNAGGAGNPGVRPRVAVAVRRREDAEGRANRRGGSCAVISAAASEPGDSGGEWKAKRGSASEPNTRGAPRGVKTSEASRGRPRPERERRSSKVASAREGTLNAQRTPGEVGRTPERAAQGPGG